MTGRILSINYTQDFMKIDGRDGKTYYGQFDIDDHFDLEHGMFVEFIPYVDNEDRGDGFTTATNIKFLRAGLSLV